MSTKLEEQPESTRNTKHSFSPDIITMHSKAKTSNIAFLIKFSF